MYFTVVYKIVNNQYITMNRTSYNNKINNIYSVNIVKLTTAFNVVSITTKFNKIIYVSKSINNNLNK